MDRKPNIVLILTDDQGWGDLSRTGNTNLSTPRIDQLAADGATMEWFYVQPLCAPTRAEILTGRYFPRTGVRGVTRRAECLDLDEVTIGDVFKAAGFRTGCFGKWHSGSVYPYHPNGRGFDEFFGFCCGHWSHYFDSTLEHNGEEVKAEGYIIDVLTDKTMEFMEANRDRPFLCYVPFNTPHSPFQVPDRWFDRFEDAEVGMRHREPEKEDLDVTRSVLAMCENIDWNVGRLVDKVAELGLTEDTIFIYLSDNGPNSCRWNGGMCGRKGSADEGGARTCCSITWPGHIQAGTKVDQIAGDIDFLPTLADLAEIQMIETKPLDGVSLRPLLVGSVEDWPGRAIFAQSADGKVTSIRTQQYRAGGHSGGLYDMEQDLGQHDDLSDKLPELNRELRQRIDDWRADVIPQGPPPDRPLPAGYREFPKTYLNAQDGLPTGDITWSSIHPNASFFIHWHNVEDHIHWELDVKTAGAYDVTMMYTCREGDVGSTVEVESGTGKLQATITDPFDPPLKDRDDRIQRKESYEKEFRPLPMGRIRLEEGLGDFQLRVLDKPGEEVCDLRALRLDLVEPDVE